MRGVQEINNPTHFNKATQDSTEHGVLMEFK